MTSKSTPESRSENEAERVLGKIASGHVRRAQGLMVSSIGLGTRLGSPDVGTDERYQESIFEAVARGCNFFDTANHYREGRSETVLGRALEALRREGRLGEEPVVSTKGGTVLREDEIEGASADALVDGRYGLWPALIEEQILRSRENLRVERIDIYYLEGLEAHVRARGADFLRGSLARAFAALEKARERGWIRYYGVASPSGLLGQNEDDDYLSLSEIGRVARHAGGAAHGLRFVQAPYSITFPSAMTARNQVTQEGSESLIDGAGREGMSFIAAEPLAAGRALDEEHPWLSGVLSTSGTLVQRSLQFVRSTPGVTAAVVGMSRTEHVAENLALAHVPPVSRHTYEQLVPPEAPQTPWLF